jgi:hypothetical protein
MRERARVQAPHEPNDPLLSEIAEVVLYPDTWLDTPNDRLGGQSPRTLLSFEDGRELLYNLVQNVKHGMMT